MYFAIAGKAVPDTRCVVNDSTRRGSNVTAITSRTPHRPDQGEAIRRRFASSGDSRPRARPTRRRARAPVRWSTRCGQVLEEIDGAHHSHIPGLPVGASSVQRPRAPIVFPTKRVPTAEGYDPGAGPGHDGQLPPLPEAVDVDEAEVAQPAQMRLDGDELVRRVVVVRVAAERGEELVVQRVASATRRARGSTNSPPGPQAVEHLAVERALARRARGGGSRSSTRRRRTRRASAGSGWSRSCCADLDPRSSPRSAPARGRASRRRKSSPTPVAPGRAASTSASVMPSPVPRSSTRSTARRQELAAAPRSPRRGAGSSSRARRYASACSAFDPAVDVSPAGSRPDHRSRAHRRRARAGARSCSPR